MLLKRGSACTGLAFRRQQRPIHKPPSDSDHFRARPVKQSVSAAAADSKRTAVVSGTGTFNGIGRACVREFLKQGYVVVGLDMNPPEDVEADEVLQQFQGSHHFLEVDVSEEASVKNAVGAARQFFGDQVHCVVNNAGLAIPSMPDDPAEKVAAFRKFLAVNLEGAFILAEACIPFMPARQSSIIHISSIRSKFAEPNTEGYTSSKAGMLGLTRAQAVSLDKKVRVNTVMPGYIDTPGSAGEITQDQHDWHLVGRAGHPQDIAHAVVFLADEEKAGFIDGCELMIDGGVSAKLVYPD
ncbi:hypothetical protein WJX84_004163 [Apatococcus fuscideae]|uniref:Uncharacterized protein n=1 Tax=Apatococcus fuscideae TaxID=2026836 RepID=A0AAW1TF50_9CHLO